MYIPKYFQVEDRERLVEFIQQNSFGILISQLDGIPFASHLPFLIDIENQRLTSHMARANPQWKSIENEVMVIFHGPHTYISPTWYEEEKTVPTWNYIAVHLYGEFHIIEEPTETIRTMTELVNTYESTMPNPWSVDFNSDYAKGLLKGIVGFEIRINRIEGKWKLNQNHPLERQKRVVNALKKQNDQYSHSTEIALLMEKNLIRNE